MKLYCSRLLQYSFMKPTRLQSSGCPITHHFCERLCRGEEDGVGDVVNAGHNDPEAGPGEDVRIVALPRLVRLQTWRQHCKGNVVHYYS